MRFRGIGFTLAILLVVSGVAWAQTTIGTGTTTTTTGDSTVYTPSSLQWDYDFSSIPTVSLKVEGKLGPGVIASSATTGISFTSGTADYDAEASIQRTSAAPGSWNVILSVEGGVGVAFAYSKQISLFGFGSGSTGQADAEVAQTVVRMKDGVLTASDEDSAAASSTDGMDFEPFLNVSVKVQMFSSSYQTTSTLSVATSGEFNGLLRFNAAVGLGYAIGWQKAFGF